MIVCPLCRCSVPTEEDAAQRNWWMEGFWGWEDGFDRWRERPVCYGCANSLTQGANGDLYERQPEKGKPEPGEVSG